MVIVPDSIFHDPNSFKVYGLLTLLRRNKLVEEIIILLCTLPRDSMGS